MPRISRLNRDQAFGDFLTIYDRDLRHRGYVPNLLRTTAPRRRISESIIAHIDAVVTTGTLLTALNEFCFVRTSQLTCIEYCLASHTPLAKRPCWSDDQIAALHAAATVRSSPTPRTSQSISREI